MQTPSPFYITTAIDYVNNLPHVGTAYEKIGADVLARFHRLMGAPVRFQMGNDEHSANVKKEADRQGLAPKAYCDAMRIAFEDIWKKLAISYDCFIQTTEPQHRQSVQRCFQKMWEKGDIYEGDYEGWYCDSCEAFYLEKDLNDGLCPHHKKKPAWIKEKNLFFRLSSYQDSLLSYIHTHPDFIRPKIRENEMTALIERGLADVSVSRSGIQWGVEIPSHPGHVVYVWFDALLNYISGLADAESMATWWPAALHIIGKDITRFHCVIWPAMLMSLGLPLPKTVFGHGFVYLKGEKMSKSLGNIVTPLDVVDRFGADALRYYLLRDGSFGHDGDFTWDNFIQRYNSDLANGLGNLLARTSGMIKRYQDGIFTEAPGDFSTQIRHQANDTLGHIRNYLDPSTGDDIDFHKALAEIWELLRLCDQYIDSQAPWTLAKTGKKAELAQVLYGLGEGLRLIALLVSPFLPETAQKIWTQLGLEALTPFAHVYYRTFAQALPAALAIGPSAPLFPRLETP